VYYPLRSGGEKISRKGKKKMGVMKSRRGLSKLEFYHSARKLRGELTGLLLRDFWAHKRARKDTAVENHTPDGYYDEIITEFAENIRRLLRNLLWNITAGNTIYPTNAEEEAERRRYQTAAIINCEQLLQEMHYRGGVSLPCALYLGGGSWFCRSVAETKKARFCVNMSLNNLGDMYADMGDYAGAEACYLEAKEIFEKVFGKEHPNYATSLKPNTTNRKYAI
jgi:tetratricopeptide (TPR) repeat protein